MLILTLMSAGERSDAAEPASPDWWRFVNPRNRYRKGPPELTRFTVPSICFQKFSPHARNAVK